MGMLRYFMNFNPGSSSRTTERRVQARPNAVREVDVGDGPVPESILHGWLTDDEKLRLQPFVQKEVRKSGSRVLEIEGKREKAAVKAGDNEQAKLAHRAARLTERENLPDPTS